MANIDGTNTNDFQVTKDQTTGESRITINCHDSTHQITITGTNVVPEFPIASLAVIVADIGVIAMLGGTRIFKPF